MFYEIYLLLIIFGAIFGSFANVCIYRLPKEQSISKKRSYCFHCKKKIQWFYNVPIFSYIFIKGRCANCNKKIPIQYLIVEIVSVFNFLIIYYFFGFTIETILLIFLFFIYTIVFFIDLKHFIIPNSLNYILIISGFAKNFVPNIDEFLFTNIYSSILGGILGYGMIWFIIKFYKKLKKIDGMGFGDAKLFCAIGFWFGHQAVFIIIFLASFSALLIIMPSLIKGNRNFKSAIPFGPFIIFGNLMYLIFQYEIFSFLSIL